MIENVAIKRMTDTQASKPIKVFIATQNPGKRRELQEILDEWQSSTGQQSCAFELLNAASDIDIEETGHTFAENARIKAFGYFNAANPDADFLIAEDSGLIVDALDGYGGISPFPGVISKRWLTDELQASITGKPLEHAIRQNDLNHAIIYLVDSMAKRHRQARYCCAMTLLNGKTGELLHESYGEMPLQVAFSEKGKGGFGYDPIMHPISDTLVLPVTVAELSPCLKNRLSHRGKAFRQALDFLKALDQQRQSF